MYNVYINSDKDEDLCWNDKPLNFTYHALLELDESKKNSDAVLEILEKGTHRKESKEKYIAKLKAKTRTSEVVYIERKNDILIIHLRL